MKINLHSNGWTGLIEDLDFAKITQDEVNQLAQFLATNTLVVARGQGHLTVKDEVRAVDMFGNVEDFTPMMHLAPYNHCVIPGSDNKVVRVTGELDEHGRPGLFGHVSDLDWHCNQPALSTRRPLVWLLGIKGTVGSRTSWNNNILAYDDLDSATKEAIKDLQMVCGYKRGNYTEMSFGKEEDFNEYYTPRLVHTNIGRRTGLFFPFLQFRNFVGMTEQASLELAKPLIDHILQEKYIYHHDWQDGDVVIAEQWLGIHKRWAFDGMSNRVLHRSTFDFPNINFN
jgi:alpha-ketoglutarate-dependent taurine dioxygenase